MNPLLTAVRTATDIAPADFSNDTWWIVLIKAKQKCNNI